MAKEEEINTTIKRRALNCQSKMAQRLNFTLNIDNYNAIIKVYVYLISWNQSGTRYLLITGELNNKVNSSLYIWLYECQTQKLIVAVPDPKVQQFYDYGSNRPPKFNLISLSLVLKWLIRYMHGAIYLF